MPAESLPPLVQEIRSDASQAIAEQDKFNASTTKMADHAEEEGERSKGGFLAMVGGLGLAGVAAGVTEKAMEGLHKVIETGVERAKDDQLINAQLAAGIKSTGGAAGTTVEGMDALGDSIAKMSGQTSDSIDQAQTLLLTFHNIRNVGANKIFDQATLATANMAARMGGSATQAAQRLGRALEDPAKGMSSLSRAGVVFSTAEQKQIKAMEASGNLMGAQQMVLAKLQQSFGGSAKAAGETLPGALARARESFAQMSGDIVSKFLPVVSQMMNGLVGGFSKASPFIDQFTSFLASSLSKLGPMFAPLGAAMGGMFKAAQPLIQDVMSLFTRLGPVITGLLGPLLKVAQSASPFMIVLNALKPVLPVLINALVSLGQSIGTALTDALQTLAPILQQVSQIFSSVLSQALIAIVPIISTMAQVIGQALVTAVTAIAPLLTMMGKFLGDIFHAIAPLLPALLSLVAAFLPLIAPIVLLVGSLLKPLVDLLTILLQPVLALVQGLIQMLVPALQQMVMWFTQYVTPIIRAAQTVLQGLSDFITGVFTGDWSRAWTGIQGIFEGVWNGIVSIAEGAVNSVIDLINTLVGGIDGALGAIKAVTGGAVNLNIPKIPHVSFDVGGDIPGAPGAPLPAIVHGGESMASNAMLAGRQPLPSRIMAAADAQRAREGRGGGGTVNNFNVNVTQTYPSDAQIAQALSFHLAMNGG